MIRYNRGSRIPIATIFYDSTGGIVYPASVNITIAYADGSTDSRWPLDGTELESTTVTMTTPTTASTDALVGQWRTTWDSAVASPGVVYWSAVPSTDVFTNINEGKFELRGGLANPIAVPTTL